MMILLLVAAPDARPAPLDTDSVRPAVIVVLVGKTAVQRTSEERFSVELRLALDRFEVHQVDLRSTRFADSPMSARLEQIEEFSRRYDACATAWVEQAADGRVLLNVVALSTGRALLRIVEARSGPSTEVELALAAQELLGEAYMFGPEARDEAITGVVRQVVESIVPPSPAEETPVAKQPPRWGLIPLFTSSGELGPSAGPSFRVGGGLAAQLRLVEGLYGRLGLNVLGGPKEVLGDGVISGMAVAPGLTLGYEWPIGPVRLGPVIEGRVRWSRVEMALGKGDNQSFEWFDFHAAGGFDLQVPIKESFAIVLDGLVGLSSQRQSFRRLSDLSLVMTTPLVDWTASVGFLVTL